MYNYNFDSMSTKVQISINTELPEKGLMPVYELFAAIEDTCSRFKADSELSKINRQVGKEVEISDNLFSILKEALRFYKETNGVFNPGILTAIEINGYARSIEYIRGQEVGGYSLAIPMVNELEPYQLNDEKQSVVLKTRIDLGGIAKGWVVDRAAELLSKYGYGFVNVGGDMRIFGSLPRPLNIGIEDPDDSAKMISSIQVSEGAVATSASRKRSWKLNGSNKHHLIDPRTGEPSSSTIISSTVTAPTAMEADVLAKVTLLLGEKEGKRFISDKKAKAVLVNEVKEVWEQQEEF